MNHLGLDVHSAHFVLAYVNAAGRLCRQYERNTSGENLIDILAKVRGPKRLIVEECHLAQWVKHIAEPYVDELVVCDPQRNRWIAEDDFANDQSSARKLGQLSQGGFIRAIRHPDDVGAELRSLFLHYYNLSRQNTRFKNMLKATFRQVAIRAPGAGIYEAENRKAWLTKLQGFPSLQRRARHCFKLVETVTKLKDDAFKAMAGRAKKSPTYTLLQTIPGVGPVVSSGYIALIDTPDRFSRKNKLWAYACLGKKHHESDEKVYATRRSRTGCRPLKWLAMEQFHTGVLGTKSSNRFKRQYEHLLRSGLGRRMARRHVCRSMLSVVRSVWMKGEAYRDDA
ncbi:MAG: transposase [Planctomycetota bacterium]|jgi:transposase